MNNAGTHIYPRYIQPRIVEALADTPVVLLSGPRQAGKTTLVRQFSFAHRKFVTLDDELTLLAARQDPVGLIRSLDCAVIDEVQRAPALLLAIKKSVDEDRRPGRFLLTGSANLMTLPTVADSLAGRMETLIMLPLAGCEMQSSAGKWIDAVYDGRIPKTERPEVGDKLVEKVLRGGYPDAVSRATPRRRAAWAKQYVDALIQRDVRDIASIDKLDHLPRLLKSLAQMAGQLCNFTQLGGQVGLDSKTANKYLAVFEQMFLLRRVEPWSSNRLSRIVKTPKIQFIDSGLLSTLVDLNEAPAIRDRALFGRVLENHVYSELLKQATWAERNYTLHTYRDKDQVEVDFVIEDLAEQVVGVEVKAAASVSAGDLSGLKKLAALAGKQFVAGIVLYDGNDTLPIGERLWAVPLSTLWND
ncbi:ATP-binding protein [Ferrovum sp.]|uniref:ATP-binding protein n=1 Tax=Ferrovum sp. TaxID=2609467 RepID=UPI0026128507|nr:ATP-binding protein [Ferrovum sp.]